MKGRLAERSKAAVLKTVRAKVHVGSNPTPSDSLHSCNASIPFCIGMMRGLLAKHLNGLTSEDLETLLEIDRIIEAVYYLPYMKKDGAVK